MPQWREKATQQQQTKQNKQQNRNLPTHGSSQPLSLFLFAKTLRRLWHCERRGHDVVHGSHLFIVVCLVRELYMYAHTVAGRAGGLLKHYYPRRHHRIFIAHFLPNS